MKKEYDLRRLRLKRRGAVVNRRAKVMKTIRLDADVLEWLVARAGEDRIGYQTLLNALLRRAMAGQDPPMKGLRAEIRKIVREELKHAS